MGTEKRYYDNPYARSIMAHVTKVDNDKVYLDKTIAYPEGGGQPGDRGTLNNKEFIDTQKDGEFIYHLCPNNNFSVGDKLLLNLDWEHRYTYMKVHSAQHILSGILYNKFFVGTLSVHQGESQLTIEIDKESFDEQHCHFLENEANKAINRCEKISYREMDEDMAQKLPLRRSIKAHGLIRLVDISNVDSIACGGLHVEHTSEVNYILYVGQEIVRSHVRLIFKVGDEAKKTLRLMQSIVDELNVRHSAQSFELLEIDEKNTNKILELERENKELKQLVASNVLSTLISKCDSDMIICEDLSSFPFQLSAFNDLLKEHDIALLFIKKVEDEIRWLIYLGPSYNHIPLKLLKSELFSIVNAKGGGRPPLYQGKADNRDLDKFLSSFRTLINEKTKRE
jgi:alanyl-tRNA synthetase